MNATEAAILCRYVKAACPQQAIDEYTPAAWGDLLADIRLEDAKVAVRAVVSRQPFIAPAEIRDEVKRIRAKRIADHPILTPPPGTEAEQRAWLGEAKRRIGDGGMVDSDAAYELKPRDLGELRELARGRIEETDHA